MKFSTVMLGAFIIFIGCDNVSGSLEQLPPEELILGSWQVSFARIDNQVYPVTTPGFGQMRAIIAENTILYIYPDVDDNGLPTAKNDSLYAFWSFNNDNSLITISNPQDNSTLLVWEVLNLSVGLLKTSYEAQSPSSTEATSTYELTYSLTE